MFIKRMVWALPLLLASFAAQADSVALMQRRALTHETAAWIKARDFRGLMQQMAIEERSEERLADGLWRLDLRHSAFEEQLRLSTRTDKDWKRVLDQLRKEAREWPMAWLLYADAIYSLAWKTRGPGFAYTVKPADMATFKTLLTQARDVLDQHKGGPSGARAHWYARRLHVALELGESAESRQALFEEAVAWHPRYHAIYFAHARAASSQWGGNKQAQLHLLNRVAKLGSAAEEGMVARLLWVLSGDLFPDESTRSPALYRAIEAIARQYPDEWNMQAVFMFACASSNKSLAIKLLPGLPARYIGAMDFANEEQFRTCKQWARGEHSSFFLSAQEQDGKSRMVFVD